MGVDFIERATPTFKKSWDRARVALATADLFTRLPEYTARVAEADIIGNAELEIGDQLIVEVQGNRLVARRGNSDVALFTNPPPALFEAVTASFGIAKGIVERVHSIAGVVEISLC